MAKATKASDKAQICRRTVAALQKMYGKSLPRLDLTVLETFLFAICLEDNSWQDAQQAQARLLGAYFDLNEIRVSSVSELEQSLLPLRGADWKGLQIRAILRHVFETTYSFDFEKFRRLTQEAAVKVLKKIPELTPFVRDFALQHLLDSHLVALDTSMLNAARWLGLVPASHDLSAAAESLKAVVRKSDVNELCCLLRALATDVRFRDRLAETPERELEMHEALERLSELQMPPKRRPVRRSGDRPEVDAVPAGADSAARKSKTAVVDEDSAPRRSKSAVVPGPERTVAEKGQTVPAGSRKTTTTPAGKPSAAAPEAAQPKTAARTAAKGKARPAPAPGEKASGSAAVQPEIGADNHGSGARSGSRTAGKPGKSAREHSTARGVTPKRIQSSGVVPEKRGNSKPGGSKAPRGK